MKSIVNVVPSWPSKYKPYDCVFIYEQVKNLALRSDLNFVVIVGYPIGWYVKNKKLWFLDAPKKIDLPNVTIITFFYHNAFKLYDSASDVVFKKIKTYFSNVYSYSDQVLIHAHFTTMGVHALKLSKEYKVNFILTEHSGKFIHYQEIHKLSREKINEILGNSKEIIAVSQHVKNDILNHTTIELGKICIIPNGVDTERFYPMLTYKKGFKLLYVGNLFEAKGVKILLEAFTKLTKQNDFTLTIVGSGNLKNYCEKFIHKHFLEQTVYLVGAVNHADLPKIMNEHHVLLLPSYSESFGIVIVESLLCGIPAIATSCGGPEFILNSPSLGKLIPLGDSNALASAVEEVHLNYKNYNADKMRSNMIKRFGWDKVAFEILEKYQFTTNK